MFYFKNYDIIDIERKVINLARHIVKCKICGQQFDADKEPSVKVSSTRYAHKKCVENPEAVLSPEDLDKMELENYLLQLFNLQYVEPQMKKMIQKFIEQDNFTYSGIRKALIYFYEVKGNPIDDKGKTLGIIPYVYEESRRYFYSLWQAQQSNADKDIESYKPKIKEISIPVPEVKERRKKLFSFLDESEVDT